MTRPHSLDLREPMVRAVEAGASRRATAAQFEVSPSCVIKLVQRWRQKGTLAPQPRRGGRRAELAGHGELVQALLAATPDITIAEPRGRRHRGQPGGDQPLPQGLRADANKRTAHAAEQERPDVAAAQRAWRAQQPQLSPERLVFIDETWATTAMTRRYGAPRGRRVGAAVSHGHWKTTTFVAALRHDGLSAPWVFDGAINGARFFGLPGAGPGADPARGRRGTPPERGRKLYLQLGPESRWSKSAAQVGRLYLRLRNIH